MYKRILILLSILLVLSSLAGCENQDKKVVVASKPHAEQYILAEMITLLVENHTDIEVEQKIGIGGGTSNIHPGLLAGEIDIYPEYTGTGWLFVLKEDLITDPDDLYDAVREGYMEEFNVKWLDLYGFNNTYALAIKESLAKKLNIDTYSDLASESNNLVFGAEYDFYERDDGFNGLSKTYGFNFKDKSEIDIGLKYDAIASDEIDVINAFSTDGLLKKHKLRVLKDDKNYFPSYHAATIIRKDTLKQYPELQEVLNMLGGRINNKEMIQMNYLVEKENMDPKKVAEEFLIRKGLLQ